MNLVNDHGIITIKDSNRCLGYLMDFGDRGIYNAEHGKVDVSKTAAKLHNKLLDQGVVDGLDKCDIGQTTPVPFYVQSKGGFGVQVRTWLGTVLAEPEDITFSDRNITFTRKERKFEGELSTDHDDTSVYFTRVE